MLLLTNVRVNENRAHGGSPKKEKTLPQAANSENSRTEPKSFTFTTPKRPKPEASTSCVHSRGALLFRKIGT